MSDQLRLNFDLSQYGNLFVAGSEAKGILKVATLNDVKINRIKIGVVGKVAIEADENGNHTALERIFYCSGQYIFDSSDVKIENDDQFVEFKVPLDNNLPPSLVLKDFSIHYSLYTTMEEQFSDGTVQVINTHTNISIVTLVDCNTIPKAKKEKLAKGTPVTSCICIRREDSDDCLQISPRAYVPGDCIKINAVILNRQNYPMVYVQVALIQKVKIKYEERVMKRQRIVSETKRGSVMPHQPQVWHDEFLRIPPLPPTTYHKIVQITYKLQMIPVRHNNNEAKPILSVPVIIGNLPLEAALAHFNPLHYDMFDKKILNIQTPYQEYASAEKCIQPVNKSQFVPSYISYVTERAMDNIQLQDPR